MGNTLTGLIPTIQAGLDIVSRELVGAVPAVSIDASANMLAVGQTERVPIVPAAGANVSITPGDRPSDDGDVVMEYVDMSITKSKMQPVRWTGIDQKGLSTGGQYSKINADRFAQAFRALVAEVETDILTAGYQGASRAIGTATTNPFASNHDSIIDLRKVLDDNGCPSADRTCIINTTAGAALRKLTGLNTVYAAGTDATLRQGTLLPLSGFDIKESAYVVSHTKGAGTGYVIVAAGEAAGQTTISLDGGTVNTTGFKAGDIVTFGTGGGSGTGTDYDTKYVVNTGLTATSGDIIIGKPGLRVARVNDDVATIGGSYTANIGFHRSAIQLLARAPELPIEGDEASDVTYVTDPITGLVFQVCMYKSYKRVKYEVGLAWGVKAIKPEHIAVLVG
jgi:P22 coat protein - gene protein 5